MPQEITGLTASQVAERLADGRANSAVRPNIKSTPKIISENLFTYFNAIFALLTILLIISGNTAINQFTFLPIVIVNAVTGIIQELRSRKIVSQLAIVTTPHVTVLREGELQVIDVHEVVLDDVIQLQAGQQISVDAQVLSGQIEVNESILTGEADELTKTAGMELLSGSFVVTGDCLAQVTRVGEETYAAKLIKETKTIKHKEQSQMVRAINRIVMWMGIFIIPLGLIMMYQSMVINQNDFATAVRSMVSAILGLIPEGLYLLTTVSLVASTMRLAQKKVVLHDMKSVEQLARVDVLCIDKTGTITENDMQVQSYYTTPIYETSPEGSQSIESLLAQVVTDLGADNDTMQAIEARFAKESKRGWTKQDVLPFKSSNKYSAVLYPEATYFIGAPEILLGPNFSQYQEELQTAASQGYRVLAFGKMPLATKELDSSLFQPYAFIHISNPIRKEAPATFAYFKSQEVAIKVISGDDPITVSSVAQRAQIEGADHYIDARSLTSPEQVEAAAQTYTVFGRVTPELKRQLVQALQGQGHTVAMTGDGVNDVLALKEADCSIAMAAGSDAALHASQIVLLDNNFASLPSVVAEGRRTVNNIERSASLFLFKNIFTLILSALSVLFAISFPLKSAQISLISAFLIGIPGYLLTFEPNNQRISGNFIIKVLKRALPPAIAAVTGIGLLLLSGTIFENSSNEISTVATFILAATGFLSLIQVMRPLNLTKLGILAVSLVGFVLTTTFFKGVFEISAFSFEVGILGFLFLLVGDSINHNLRLILDFVFDKRWKEWQLFQKKS